MHAYFDHLKARCACFSGKIHLKRSRKKTFIMAHCFDRPQVRPFDNSVFINWTMGLILFPANFC